MVSHLLPPELASGSEIQAMRLARALSKLGVEVSIVTSGPPRDEDVHGHIRIYTVPTKENPRTLGLRARLPHSGAMYRRVASLVRHVDVIHLHGMHFTHTTLPALLAARRSRVPCVLKIPASGPEEFLEYYGWMPFSNSLHRWVLSCEALVVVCQTAFERTLAAGIPPQRLHRIPNGIESDNQGVVVPDDRSDCFLFCGTLNHRKGWDLALEAWEKVAPVLDRWKLLVAGFHPEEDRVRAMCHKRWGTRVEYQGYVQNVAPLIRQAACLVQPSRDEGLSNAVLEAMSQGTPVVASDAGGNPELVRHGHNGLLFPSGDATALVRCLLEIASKSEAERSIMGENARRLIRDSYSMERVGSAYLDLYHSLVTQEQ